MFCRITDLHNKEVINVGDGCRLGCVDDVEVDTCTAQMCAIVIRGRRGLLGHTDDIVIPWKDIEVIGEETILVSFCPPAGAACNRRKKSLFSGIFG